eukprot:PhM_4_TR16771/c0_g1_i1/m.22749
MPSFLRSEMTSRLFPPSSTSVPSSHCSSHVADDVVTLAGRCSVAQITRRFGALVLAMMSPVAFRTKMISVLVTYKIATDETAQASICDVPCSRWGTHSVFACSEVSLSVRSRGAIATWRIASNHGTSDGGTAASSPARAGAANVALTAVIRDSSVPMTMATFHIVSMLLGDSVVSTWLTRRCSMAERAVPAGGFSRPCASSSGWSKVWTFGETTLSIVNATIQSSGCGFEMWGRCGFQLRSADGDATGAALLRPAKMAATFARKSFQGMSLHDMDAVAEDRTYVTSSPTTTRLGSSPTELWCGGDGKRQRTLLAFLMGSGTTDQHARRRSARVIDSNCPISDGRSGGSDAKSKRSTGGGAVDLRSWSLYGTKEASAAAELFCWD